MSIAAATAGDRRNEHRFFGGMAIAIAVTIVTGFARTYYLRPVFAAGGSHFDRGLTPLIHLHAALYSGWIALLVVQSQLVARGRIAVHRRLGVAGTCLAVLMVPVGVVVALQGVLRGVAPPGFEPRRFLALPFFAVVVFAAVFAFAFAARRSPPTHKRLILLATLALLPPAIARWLVFQLGFSPAAVLAAVALFLIPLLVWDFKTLGRLHPATLWGGLFVVASGPLRLLVSRTDAWLAFTDWAVRLVS